jgi:pimeloyl-ACP methyl ester carboxylesterase
MERTDVGDLRIAYQRAGQGPPLLLLHGAVSDSRVWRLALAAFAGDHTVIAWDSPGCGESTDPPDDFRMHDFAACLAGFVEALELDRPHVVGHSWGSTLALQLSLDHPSSVRSLILVGGYAGWAGSLPADEVQRRLDFAIRAADAIDAGTWDPRSMPGLFSDVMPTEQAEELTRIMSDIRPAGIRPAGTRTMARALAECDLSDSLQQVRVPTLLVHGDEDERSSLSVGRRLHGSIPGSTLTVLPGLGHECCLEDPAAFEAAVRTFLQAVEAGAGDPP